MEYRFGPLSPIIKASTSSLIMAPMFSAGFQSGESRKAMHFIRSMTRSLSESIFPAISQAILTFNTAFDPVFDGLSNDVGHE